MVETYFWLKLIFSLGLHWKILFIYQFFIQTPMKIIFIIIPFELSVETRFWNPLLIRTLRIHCKPLFTAVIFVLHDDFAVKRCEYGSPNNNMRQNLQPWSSPSSFNCPHYELKTWKSCCIALMKVFIQGAFWNFEHVLGNAIHIW